MRKLLGFVLIVSMVIGLTACGAESKVNDEKINIVTTIYPGYDWVKEILGDQCENVEVTMLLENGVDLHSYQPAAKDIMKISTCDFFIYVGGESDSWVEDALEESKNKDMKVINFLEILDGQLKEEEIVEGMQGEEEEEAEYDEHVWLSLKNAKVLVEKISETLSQIDSENADVYKKNTENYLEKIEVLNQKYKETVESSKNKTILFADRFPFRYLVDEYGVSYYAAFAGCSAETEASFETIVFLIKKIDELNLNTVLTIEGSDQKLAETIINNTKWKNQSIKTMDSMQGITSKDVENGVTYLSVMEENLEVLKQALK